MHCRCFNISLSEKIELIVNIRPTHQIVIVSALLFFSCNNDDAPTVADLYGNWEIDYIYNTSFSTTPERRTDKADLSFISALKFNNDGTVRKEVAGENIEMHAAGEYVIEDVSKKTTDHLPQLKNTKVVTVTYSEKSENFYQSGCYQDTETYYLFSDGRLKNRHWAHCDGPIESYLKR